MNLPLTLWGLAGGLAAALLFALLWKVDKIWRSYE